MSRFQHTLVATICWVAMSVLPAVAQQTVHMSPLTAMAYEHNSALIELWGSPYGLSAAQTTPAGGSFFCGLSLPGDMLVDSVTVTLQCGELLNTRVMRNGSTLGSAGFQSHCPGSYTIDVTDQSTDGAWSLMFDLAPQPVVIRSISVHLVPELSAAGDLEMPWAAEVTKPSNHPNPFNPSTTIAYEIPWAADVGLRIYDAKGMHVRTLVSRSHEAGRFETVWDGKHENGQQAASGVYFYELVVDDDRVTNKMLLVK